MPDRVKCAWLSLWLPYVLQPLYNAGVVWSHLGNRPKALDCLLQAQKSQNDLKRLNIDQVIAAVDVSIVIFLLFSVVVQL